MCIQVFLTVLVIAGVIAFFCSILDKDGLGSRAAKFIGGLSCIVIVLSIASAILCSVWSS